MMEDTRYRLRARHEAGSLNISFLPTPFSPSLLGGPPFLYYLFLLAAGEGAIVKLTRLMVSSHDRPIFDATPC